MNIFQHFEGLLAEAVAALQAEGALPADLPVSRLAVEPPRDPAHGDIASNAAMVLAKPTGTNPRALAELLAAKLQTLPGVARVDIAGPGFINLALSPDFWPKIVADVLDQGIEFGRSEAGGSAAVNVEYVSANPTGPMHVGHCRGAVFGDALSNLLDFAGFAVTREYYINDAGGQVDVLARSAYLRYREALGESIGEIPEGLYPGDYLVPVGKKLAQSFGDSLKILPEQVWLPVVRNVAIEAMMRMIKTDLKALNIKHDKFSSERALITGKRDQVAETIVDLASAGQIYLGHLPPPKGEPSDDWEDREQLLFRATSFGDDVDRALVKSTGAYTYFANDMAYHRDKFHRGFNKMIDVWGADHAGYIKRMQSAVKALTDGKGELDVKVCQLVKLYRGGEPVKMSKRSGTFVTLRDVVNEVGADAVRFMMLYRKNDAALDFDFAKVTEQSRDNPVFYVQYAHARAFSIFRNAAEHFAWLDAEAIATGMPDFSGAQLHLLTDEGEIGLIKRIAQWPRLVEAAANAHEPHRIAFYLYDLASDFHQQWNRGKDAPHLRFICEDEEALTRARLALVAATSNVIHAGLRVLGVQAPREMR